MLLEVALDLLEGTRSRVAVFVWTLELSVACLVSLDVERDVCTQW